jgi:hypothetical protein
MIPVARALERRAPRALVFFWGAQAASLQLPVRLELSAIRRDSVWTASLQMMASGVAGRLPATQANSHRSSIRQVGASKAEDNYERNLVHKFSARKFNRWFNRLILIISIRPTHIIYRTQTSRCSNELQSRRKAKIATSAFANCASR